VAIALELNYGDSLLNALFMANEWYGLLTLLFFEIGEKSGTVYYLIDLYKDSG